MSVGHFLSGFLNEFANQAHQTRLDQRAREDKELEARRGYVKTLYDKMLETGEGGPQLAMALKDMQTLSEAQNSQRPRAKGKAGFAGASDLSSITTPFLDQIIHGDVDLFKQPLPSMDGAGPIVPSAPAGPMAAPAPLTPPPTGPMSGSGLSVPALTPPPGSLGLSAPQGGVHFGDSRLVGGTPPPQQPFNSPHFGFAPPPPTFSLGASAPAAVGADAPPPPPLAAVPPLTPPPGSKPYLFRTPDQRAIDMATAEAKLKQSQADQAKARKLADIDAMEAAHQITPQSAANARVFVASDGAINYAKQTDKVLSTRVLGADLPGIPVDLGNGQLGESDPKKPYRYVSREGQNLLIPINDRETKTAQQKDEESQAAALVAAGKVSDVQSALTVLRATKANQTLATLAKTQAGIQQINRIAANRDERIALSQLNSLVGNDPNVSGLDKLNLLNSMREAKDLPPVNLAGASQQLLDNTFAHPKYMSVEGRRASSSIELAQYELQNVMKDLSEMEQASKEGLPTSPWEQKIQGSLYKLGFGSDDKGSLLNKVNENLIQHTGMAQIYAMRGALTGRPNESLQDMITLHLTDPMSSPAAIRNRALELQDMLQFAQNELRQKETKNLAQMGREQTAKGAGGNTGKITEPPNIYKGEVRTDGSKSFGLVDGKVVEVTKGPNGQWVKK